MGGGTRTHSRTMEQTDCPRGPIAELQKALKPAELTLTQKFQVLRASIPVLCGGVDPPCDRALCKHWVYREVNGGEP